MAHGFNNEFYKKYDYAHHLIIGVFFIICSIAIFISGIETIFNNKLLDLNDYISTSDNINKELPVNKKVKISYIKNHGCFFIDRDMKKGYSDYYLVELDDGLLIAIQTAESKEDEIVSKDFIGYVHYLRDDVNNTYRIYISELKDNGILDNDSQVIMAVVNGKNESIGYVIFSILFLGVGAYELVEGLFLLKKR